MTREKVVRTALRLLDRVGLDGLTLRKLATELRVRAPALYWHFQNKQELLDEMATRVLTEPLRKKPLTPRWAYLAWHFFRGRHRTATGKKARAAFSLEGRYPFFDRRVMEFCLALPPEQKLAQGWNAARARGDWPDWAVHLGHGIRRMLLRHRDGAKMVSGTYLTNTALYLPIEAALHRLVEAGFTASDAICAYRAIYCYAVGFTIEEQAVYPRPDKRDPRYHLKRRAARMIPAEQFPLVLAAGEEMFDFERQFQQGLQLIVRGLRPSGGRATTKG